MNYEEELEDLRKYKEHLDSIKKFTGGKLNFDKYANKTSKQSSKTPSELGESLNLSPFDGDTSMATKSNRLKRVFTPSVTTSYTNTLKNTMSSNANNEETK